MGKLSQKLKTVSKIPMHMPGHKRNIEKFPQMSELFKTDITEIDGFDNLHSPQGILKTSMEKASGIFESENSIYLVNGSTCGILAGICAVVGDGDKVIADRISHKSVYNAIELSGATPVFLLPEFHKDYGLSLGITPELIEKALVKNPDTKLIILTSPTYEGAICDISGICKIAHRYNIPVLVDSAHGAHLGFSLFPESAVKCGADIVIQSLHKTLPSLTQTAICHVSDKYYKAVMDKLSVFESSSPSYLLMSSIDSCMDIIQDENLFSQWYDLVIRFRESAKKLKNLKIIEKDSCFFDYDISKIVIFTNDASRLSARLRDYNIEPEMTSLYYVLCMTGAGDTKNTLTHLEKVLLEIDKEFSPFEISSLYPPVPQLGMNAKQAKHHPSEYVLPQEAYGRISAEYIWAYPPGVPIIAPGEIIDRDVLCTFTLYESKNIELFGGAFHIPGKILVLST